MKLKQFCSIIVSVLLLGGCAESVDTSQPTGSGQVSRNDSLPVAFDAYQNRTITRSGWAGVLENTQLKETKANGGGFGVFAYYTDLKNYDQTYVPNFMYNRGVFWKGENGTIPEDYWAYSPIVYWPNEYGFDAASDDEDHLSFFAYAPYTPHVSAAAGSVADATYGIVGFSRNTATGDPMVRYIASFEPEKSVDLCWGVVPSDKTAWPKIQGGSTQTLAAGFPYLNMERPLETGTQAGASSSSRIKFKFNHALAQLNVQIDTDADVTSHYDAGDELGAETKVYVRSISFTGIALQGALNLNNSVKDQALWLDWCGCTDLAYGQSVTVHDGRRDSREGAAGAEAANETPTGLNPNIIQNSTATPGVIHEYQNLFKTTSTDPATALQEAICVIPTGEAMTITIVYDVETTNPKLASYLSDGTTHGSSIENKITKTVTFGGVAGAGLESNKRYALKLHLGMNSVKFDAEVSDWATNTVNGEGWLPSNVRPITLNHTVMYLGAPQTLTATLDTDHLGQTITWENSDNTFATITNTPAWTRGTRATEQFSTVLQNVEVKPIALTGNNPVTITASLPSGDKAVCEVHVVPVVISSPNVPTPGIAISDQMLMGTTMTLTASIFPASVGNVSWSSSNPSIVSITSIGGANNATCVVSGNAVGSADITVTDPNGISSAVCTVTVTSISLNKTSLVMGAGSGITETLSVIDLPAGETVTWSSSNSSVASVDPNTGVVTAGPTVGNAIITATTSSGATATCSVTTISLALNKTSTSIGAGNDETLLVTSNPLSEPVTWSTSNSSIATVDASGKVTGVAAGTATITATGNTTGASASCTVYINSISLNNNTMSLNGSYYETLVATVSSPNTETVIWSSDDPQIAYVDPSTGEVTGVSAGTATITATINSSGAKAECTVTVTSRPLSSAVAADIGKLVGSDGLVYRQGDNSNYVKSGVTPRAMIAYAGSPNIAVSLSDTQSLGTNASTAATNLGNSNPISGYSGWHLPSLSEMQLMVGSPVGSVSQAQPCSTSIFRARFAAAGGALTVNDSYWTTTPSSTGYNWCIWFGSGTGNGGWYQNELSARNIGVLSVLNF